MGNFIREAGFGFYLVAFFGVLALAFASWQAVRPHRTRQALAIGTACLTFLSGLLGTATGLQMSAIHVAERLEAEKWLFLTGLRESLNNLVLALVFLILVSVALTIGGYRQGKVDRAQG